MCIAVSIIGAILLLTVSFFVRVVAERQEDSLKRFGRILAIILVAGAIYLPCLATYVQLTGHCPIEKVWSILETAVEEEE